MLRINDLKVWYPYNRQKVMAVRGVSMDIKKGEALGLVGRSGSGKSTIAWTLMGMIEHLGGRWSGHIEYDGLNLMPENSSAFDGIRWKKVAMVPQAAMNMFNPVMKIGASLQEVLIYHCPEMAKQQRIDRCRELMELTQLREEVLGYYPHQMSGGMKQRAALAQALACRPEFLILDEATTGLDVLTEGNLLKVVKDIQDRMNMTLLVISHDMRLVKALCHRQLVLKDGMIQKSRRYLMELMSDAYWLEDGKELEYAGC
jgi:peptide/nickel transport system ATP-binding protein